LIGMAFQKSESLSAAPSGMISSAG